MIRSHNIPDLVTIPAAQNLLTVDRRNVLLILAIAFAVFYLSPVRPLADSRFSMLVSQSLISHGTFELNHYHIRRNARPKNIENIPRQSVLLYRYPYQLEILNQRFFYYFPPGTSVLSIPFVLGSNLIGIQIAKADGSYNLRGEKAVQRFGAALLMSVLGVFFYQTARLVHIPSRAALVTVAALFGTQVWSTASRGMQSHTWNVLLTAILIFLVASHEIRKTKLQPLIVGTILPWMYFVRPTSIIPIAAMLTYFLICHRNVFGKVAVICSVWFLLFFSYSWHYFGQILPNYYSSGRLVFTNLLENFSGLLISPSRGLFIYVPILVFVIYQLIRQFKYVRHLPLIYLSLFTITGHFLVIAAFPKWWGGHCFGPRLLTDLVPWFFLITILALEPLYRGGTPAFSVRSFAAIVLLAASVLINGYGAISMNPWIWNYSPDDVDFHTERLWDWKNPQISYGLVG